MKRLALVAGLLWSASAHGQTIGPAPSGGGSSSLTVNSTPISGSGSDGCMLFSGSAKVQCPSWMFVDANKHQLTITTPLPIMSANGSSILINGNTVSEIPITHPFGIHIQAADDNTTTIYQDVFGNGIPSLVGRVALGSAASPSAVTVDKWLWHAAGRGYKATKYSVNAVSIALAAAGTFTDTSTPTYIALNTCPASFGDVDCQIEGARQGPSGGLSVGDVTYNATDPGNGFADLKSGLKINHNAMTFPAAAATITQTIASGAKALATGAIGSAACTSAQTATATGTLTTDAVAATFNADVTGVTGYVPLTSGMLTIIAYPTADAVNFKVCNNTASSITPGAVTINWRVVR